MTIRIPHPARLGLAALVAAVVTGSARADALDQVLLDNAKSIYAHLTEKGYGTVGVLKFEVLRGAQAEDAVPLTTGPLGDVMATRLENALILAIPDRAEKPLGVIRGASRTAAERDPQATYLTAEGRAKLLAGEYRQAWGKKTVTPDAILVGRVLFDPEMKKAAVSLQVFDKQQPAAVREVPLMNSLVAVTRQILADAAVPFVVPEDVYKKRGAGVVPEPLELAADHAAVPIVGPAPKPKGELGKEPEVRPAGEPPRPTDPWAEAGRVLDFRVYYNDREVRRQADGNYPDPSPGQEVYFTMKATERLGVVLTVNGINTADHDRSVKEVVSSTKWVLEPGKEYWVRGYYDAQDKKVHKFEAADNPTGVRELSRLAPADRFGLIELHIFKEVPPGTDGPSLASETGNRVLRDDPGAEAETLADSKLAIKQAIARAAQPVKRSLIIPGKSESATVEAAEFHGSFMTQVVVRYTSPTRGK